jgi:hypothetical protein
MICTAEETASSRFRALLEGMPIGAAILDGQPLRDALRPLEHYIPKVLREIHPEWEDESIDGIFPYLVTKTGDNEAEIIGLCILLSDQSLVLLHLRFRLATRTDEICWMECRLGQAGPRGMVRTPYESIMSPYKLWAKHSDLRAASDQLEWAYHVAFGNREP